jgi:hypothetical protein
VFLNVKSAEPARILPVADPTTLSWVLPSVQSNASILQ